MFHQNIETGQELHVLSEYDCRRKNYQTRFSTGADTRSATSQSAEDFPRGKILFHPLSWQHKREVSSHLYNKNKWVLQDTSHLS